MSAVPLRDTVKIGMGVRGMYKEVEKLEGQVKKQNKLFTTKIGLTRRGKKVVLCFFCHGCHNM